jgi:hypothetical protein
MISLSPMRGRTWHRTARLLPVLILTACGSEPSTLTYEVTIDRGFSDDQAAAIVVGLDDWTAALPGLRFETTVADCGSPAPHGVCIQPEHATQDQGGDDFVGLTCPGVGGDATVLLYVDRMQAAGWDTPLLLVAQTTAHEMGHVMGLRHTAAGELMAAQVPDQAHTVTRADVAQFWSVREN